ncbi:hypothetical protein ATANTOWER_020287 [Ataeniobius toweri]|uniref:Uncharacterized protein n=1 Tax=Ataeniobius toweri TaxID=208326 RepID=A0ABU7A7D4_9TELE|nr:hypothetical protein [Ataeniobius toweri]
MIIGRSIRGRITSTSLPECFVYSGSKFSPHLSLMIDRSLLQKNPDQAPAGSPFLRYSFLACMHPVHPPTTRLLGPQKLLVDPQKRPPWLSRLVSHLPGGSSPPCTPPPVPI